MNLLNKFFSIIKQFALMYKRKYIETPIKEKYADLKQKDVQLYNRRIKYEVLKILALQYFLPAIIITMFSIYAIYYYINQFIEHLGGV